MTNIQHEVIRALGRFPTAINPPTSILAKGTWYCRECGRVKQDCECGGVVVERRGDVDR
jgi:hypothetical protein